MNHSFHGGRLVASATFPLSTGAHLVFQAWLLYGIGSGHLRIPWPGGGFGDSIGAFSGEAVMDGGFYLSKLASRIDPSQLRFRNSCRATTEGGSFSRGSGGTLGRGTSDSSPNDKWLQPGRGIVLIVFDNGRERRDGWVGIKAEGTPRNRFVAVDYAWGGPGDEIATGSAGRTGIRSHGRYAKLSLREGSRSA